MFELAHGRKNDMIALASMVIERVEINASSYHDEPIASVG